MAIMPPRHRRRKRLSTNTEFALVVITAVISVVVWLVIRASRLGAARLGVVVASVTVFAVCGFFWAATDPNRPDHHPTCVPDAPGLYQGTVCD